METNVKNSPMKITTKISRRRVNELVMERLETLAGKQRLRMPAPRRRAITSATGQALSARMTEAVAKMEARQKKEPLSTQSRTLIERICREACSRKRPSFGKEADNASWRRMAEAQGVAFPGLPARTRETGPALRCLDRAEARLLRLVQAWAVKEAQREQEAQKEANGR